MNTRALKGIPPTRGMLQAAIFSPQDGEARRLVFPHSPGYGFDCGFYIKLIAGEFAGNIFTFAGIVLNEDDTESNDLIVGSFDLKQNQGQATTGLKVAERGEIQKLTGFSLPEFH